MKFCSNCGEQVIQGIPPGDDRARHICPVCETIHYSNPRIITGCLPVHNDKVLLCKRAIEPRYGLWTLPAGFMENGETTEQGAARECREEANAEVIIGNLYTITSIPDINQVHMFFHAELIRPLYSAGPESIDVQLFSEQDIPWDQLAFTAVRKTLRQFFIDRGSGKFPVHSGVAKLANDGVWIWEQA